MWALKVTLPLYIFFYISYLIWNIWLLRENARRRPRMMMMMMMINVSNGVYVHVSYISLGVDALRIGKPSLSPVLLLYSWVEKIQDSRERERMSYEWKVAESTHTDNQSNAMNY